jgi:hypothetical protein
LCAGVDASSPPETTPKWRSSRDTGQNATASVEHDGRVDPQLQWMIDKAAIIDVTVRYCTALDNKDWALLASCFSAEAVATYGQPQGGVDGPYAGVDAIVDRLRSSMTQLAVTQHCVTNHVIERHTPSSATSVCALRAQHVRISENGPEQFMVGGRYADRLVRETGEWRVSERTMSYQWTDPGWTPSGVVHPLP